MLTLEEARTRALDTITPRGPERVALSDADGRVLWSDIASPVDLPRFDYSAMDGYAIQLGSLRDDPPWSLPLAGESRTGAAAAPLPSGCVMRIFTGAPLPSGADAVIMQEDVERVGAAVRFSHRPKPMEHIRRKGEDLARGELALARGTRLHPGHIALAASLNLPELVVFRKPCVTILCTGDELYPVGTLSDTAGALPDSNTPMLACLARRAGAIVRVGTIVPDDRSETQRALRDAFDCSDVVLTVGGVSVGDHDHVREALAAIGVPISFWKVAIKPGKPIALGVRDKQLALCLPGNPASAMVTFGLFGMPLLRALQGDAHPVPEGSRARTSSELPPADRTRLIRGSLAREAGEVVFHEARTQASGATSSLAAGLGIAIVPPSPGCPLPRGSFVEFLAWSEL